MNIFLGNHRVRKKIQQDAQEKTLPHALLLSGPKGVGKFAFLEMIAEILVDKKKQQFFPPEVMKVDTLYQEGIISDMEKIAEKSFFNQSHRKKLKKKSDTIGVEDLEQFTKHLFETTSSEYKVVLIREVERMTRETANKFLKTLEEPPEKTIFLMTCSSEKKLLETFLSRVRKEHFTLASEETIQNFLDHETEDGKFSVSEKKDLQSLSAGRGEFLQELIQHPEFFKAEQEKKQEVEKIPKMTNLEKLSETEKLAKKGIAEISEILSLLEKHMRKELRNSIQKKEYSPVFLKKISTINQTKIFLAQNGNKRMILENLFLSL